MRLISWNTNGFRACLQKGFEEFFYNIDADIFAIQETKMQPEQASFLPEGYECFFHSAEKKGYSGTAVWTKKKPIQVSYGMDDYEDNEGRLITLEYEEFFFVTCYVPNAQAELARLDYRMDFEKKLRNYLMKLDTKKPVIYCGDLNVAHEEIDIKNPKANEGNAGFSKEERQAMTDLLNIGFTDTFRALYPETKEVYSWWSYRFSARAKNIGWRLDYFLVSNRLMEQVKDSKILTEVLGSDHCPVELDLEG